MSGGRLPKRIMFGNLEGAVRRGRGGWEKEWTDCVQSNIRAFGITRDWKTMALKAEVWVDAVAEGGRRFMAAWREEEEDAARHRQEKREAARLGKNRVAKKWERILKWERTATVFYVFKSELVNFEGTFGGYLYNCLFI